jgi:predicted enzyme related to lactoylglutathione lyase
MTLYIEVEDLASYRERIVGAGGKIHVEAQEVPDMGRFTLFTDPEGRMMGLWQTTR